MAAGGWFACVFPTEQSSRVEEASRQAKLAMIRNRPVVFRETEPPLLTLFAFARSSDLPPGFRDQTWVEPPLIIRTRDGQVHPEYSAVKLSVGFPP